MKKNEINKIFQKRILKLTNTNGPELHIVQS